MKGIKLSKTSWLILSAGVFVVILAGLGVTRSQQLREQSGMNQELALSQTRLNKVDVTALQQQIEDLRQQIDDGQTQLDTAKERLRQTVVSVDVTDEFFKIADFSGVTVTTLSTSKISSKATDGIGLDTISLSAQAQGDLDALVNFVVNLNNGYATGYVLSAQITLPETAVAADGESQTSGDTGEDVTTTTTETSVREPTVAVQMIVYSYEGD
jgi:hypothetical protein